MTTVDACSPAGRAQRVHLDYGVHCQRFHVSTTDDILRQEQVLQLEPALVRVLYARSTYSLWLSFVELAYHYHMKYSEDLGGALPKLDLTGVLPMTIAPTASASTSASASASAPALTRCSACRNAAAACYPCQWVTMCVNMHAVMCPKGDADRAQRVASALFHVRYHRSLSRKAVAKFAPDEAKRFSAEGKRISTLRGLVRMSDSYKGTDADVQSVTRFISDNPWMWQNLDYNRSSMYGVWKAVLHFLYRFMWSFSVDGDMPCKNIPAVRYPACASSSASSASASSSSSSSFPRSACYRCSIVAWSVGLAQSMLPAEEYARRAAEIRLEALLLLHPEDACRIADATAEPLTVVTPLTTTMETGTKTGTAGELAPLADGGGGSGGGSGGGGEEPTTTSTTHLDTPVSAPALAPPPAPTPPLKSLGAAPAVQQSTTTKTSATDDTPTTSAPTTILERLAEISAGGAAKSVDDGYGPVVRQPSAVAPLVVEYKMGSPGELIERDFRERREDARTAAKLREVSERITRERQAAFDRECAKNAQHVASPDDLLRQPEDVLPADVLEMARAGVTGVRVPATRSATSDGEPSSGAPANGTTPATDESTSTSTTNTSTRASASAPQKSATPTRKRKALSPTMPDSTTTTTTTDDVSPTTTTPTPTTTTTTTTTTSSNSAFSTWSTSSSSSRASLRAPPSPSSSAPSSAGVSSPPTKRARTSTSAASSSSSTCSDGRAADDDPTDPTPGPSEIAPVPALFTKLHEEIRRAFEASIAAHRSHDLLSVSFTTIRKLVPVAKDDDVLYVFRHMLHAQIRQFVRNPTFVPAGSASAAGEDGVLAQVRVLHAQASTCEIPSDLVGIMHKFTTQMNKHRQQAFTIRCKWAAVLAKHRTLWRQSEDAWMEFVQKNFYTPPKNNPQDVRHDLDLDFLVRKYPRFAQLCCRAHPWSWLSPRLKRKFDHDITQEMAQFSQQDKERFERLWVTPEARTAADDYWQTR